MNGENNHVFHTSALEGAQPGSELRSGPWIVLAHLAMLAAFIGMSLVAIALSTFLDGGNAYTVAGLGVGGALLTTIAFSSLIQLVDRDDDARQRAPAKVRTSPAAAQARITGMTPTL